MPKVLEEKQERQYYSCIYHPTRIFISEWHWILP